MRKFSLGLLLLAGAMQQGYAQKKPLTHDVYDQWQGISERKISENGEWIVYTVSPQEGDGQLTIQSADGRYKKTIDRGYATTLLPGGKHLVFKIRPFFKDTRDAKIKKKRPDDMPKDTLAVLILGTDSIQRITRFKTFKTAEKSGAWLAIHQEKAPADTTARPKRPMTNPVVDSLKKVIDSLQVIIAEAPEKGKKKRKKTEPALTDGFTFDYGFSLPPDTTPPNKRIEEGTELLLQNLQTGEKKNFPFVNEFTFDKTGTKLVLEITPNKKDSASQLEVFLYDLTTGKGKTIFRKANDIKSYSFDDSGNNLAFIAERDSSSKSLQKFYKLYHFRTGQDSAILRADRYNAGMPKGFTVSESPNLNFSKSGSRLFFGTTPIKSPKDTTLVDFELARLDVWHYADDYLQPQQLKQAGMESNRSYLAVLNSGADALVQLGNTDLESAQPVNEGEADFVLASTNKPGRIQSQWTGKNISNVYLVSVKDGSRKLLRERHSGSIQASPAGKYACWYNLADKQYYAYEVSSGTTRKISGGITTPLYDDEDDHPDDPQAFGFAGWFENDAAVLIYDRYDIWKVDPTGATKAVNITNGLGRKNRTELRRIQLNREIRFIKQNEPILLSAFNRTTKNSGFYKIPSADATTPQELMMSAHSYGSLEKADSADRYIVTRMNIRESADLYSTTDFSNLTKLSNLNPQQAEYNWLTVELTKWKMLDGKMAEGLLYKPENFDPKKKYPVIFYFYEKNSDDLNQYKSPAPSASTVNIPYFVSNGYIVFDPNIYYKTGQPGEDAYNSVISAANYLATMPWVDAKKMAIQGQSWGGYQVAYLVTRTNMFAAAGAGAPVANMTSAYGGIRWGTGMNRQFQYERTQSRIGATLWQRPDLYLKNSPLFKADKVNTPLLIMHNDEDGAVPWYQGIEYFTALRRLGKKVWMLQYNGEDHNLVERRNRKDLSVRMGQFFDHYLKGKPAPEWIKTGVPATQKGINWGLD